MVKASAGMRRGKAASAKDFNRIIYGVAVVASVVLSIWCAWAQFVPNPDGALYLKAAELIASGQWSDAVSIYGWPTYSIAIAGVIKLTGLEPFLAAQFISAVFAAIITVSFIGLADRLSAGDRLVVLCAAIVIIAHPQMLSLRPLIVRDTAYLAFLLLTLYLVACDIARPSLAAKLGIAISILLAGCFRVEGLFLAALVPLYYLARERGWKHASFIVPAVAAVLVAIFGMLFWQGGGFARLVRGQISFDVVQAMWTLYADDIGKRLHTLRYDFLFPNGNTGNAWGAYLGIIWGVTIVNIVRALFLPLVVLWIFVLVPKRLPPRPAAGFLLWFAFGQLPVLLIFAFATMLLDRRYANGMGLILSVPIAFLLAGLIREWQSRSQYRFFLPFVAIVLLAAWVAAMPRPSKLGYLKESGRWIGQELPAGARILTNDIRIAYFSDRPYARPNGVWVYGYNLPAGSAEGFDYYVFQAKDLNNLPEALQKVSAKRYMRSFAGKDGNEVVVFAGRSAVKQ